MPASIFSYIKRLANIHLEAAAPEDAIPIPDRD